MIYNQHLYLYGRGLTVSVTHCVFFSGISHKALHSQPPEMLEIEYGYYCGAINILLLDISMCHQNVVLKVCPRLH